MHATKRMLWAACAVTLAGCPEARVYDLSDFLTPDAGVEGDGGRTVEDDAAPGASLDAGQGASCGQDCLAGTGQCTRSGTYLCEGDEFVCDAEPAEPTAELCNTEADEDCDGNVDEAPEGRCCTDADCAEEQVCELPPGDALANGRCTEQAAAPDAATCETELLSDPMNCGACGSTCTIAEQCLNGECKLPQPRVAVGWHHSCALTLAGEVLCWGNAEPDSEMGQVTMAPSDATFDAIYAGEVVTCGIQSHDKKARCWGGDEIAPPDVAFAALAIGTQVGCGIRVDDGRVQCWQLATANAALLDPPPHVFSAIAVGALHACGIRADTQQVECWGDDSQGQALVSSGRFAAIAAGYFHVCAIRMDGFVECSGIGQTQAGYALESGQDFGQSLPPTGVEFRSLTASHFHTCALERGGAVRCWGIAGSTGDRDYLGLTNFHGQVDKAPANVSFTAISAAKYHTCGIDQLANVTCWGIDDGATFDFGQVSNAPNQEGQ